MYKSIEIFSLTIGSVSSQPVSVLLLQLLVILHGGPGQGLHDQLLGRLVVDGEGLAEANDQHGRGLLVNRLMMQINVIDQFDRLGIVHRSSAHRHSEILKLINHVTINHLLPQLELPGHLHREEEPGDDPEEEVQHSGDHEHQHRPVQ